MPRQKRTYRALEKAELRVAGLRAINPDMDFGDVRNLQYITQISQQLRTKIDAYNTALSVIDSSKSEMDELEKTLTDLTDQMLIAVAFTYGTDSSEYEISGGIRKSKRTRKSKITPLRATPKEPASDNTKTA
ncbi:hypothetical protein [uncultured Nostoc sp.]|uniref:hypothetical protein n=1 Tax=uncultured Nostoc sp. TaxID=340711 RepID=UPI0026046D70|nr:hypothetical protein [uncultured Nostoc sp.]